MDKYHDSVLELITDKGALGVNDIARALEIPPSTIQKYLMGQRYFKKNDRRKWDLPDNVNRDIKSNTLTLLVDSLQNSLNLVLAQIEELGESVQTSLVPLSTLKRGIDGLNTPVAGISGKSINVDSNLVTLDKKIKELYVVFKKYVDKCPEEYQDLISNVDLYKLVIEKGLHYLNEGFNTELTSLFLEQTDILSDEVLKILETYQK